MYILRKTAAALDGQFLFNMLIKKFSCYWWIVIYFIESLIQGDLNIMSEAS